MRSILVRPAGQTPGQAVPAAQASPPSVSVVSPQDNSIVSNTTRISASVIRGTQPDSPISRVDFIVDKRIVFSSSAETVTVGNRISVVRDVLTSTDVNIGPGKHEIIVSVTDFAGRSANSAPVNVQVSSSGFMRPNLGSLGPLGGGSVGGGTQAPVCQLPSNPLMGFARVGSQMVSADPYFNTSADRDSWLATNPSCTAPAFVPDQPLVSPQAGVPTWVWVAGGAVLVAGAAYFVMKRRR